MNNNEAIEWAERTIRYQDSAYDWAGVPVNELYGVAEVVLKLVAENIALQKALEEMAELNYNLAHQPSNVLGKVITERDELKKLLSAKQDNTYATHCECGWTKTKFDEDGEIVE